MKDMSQSPNASDPHHLNRFVEAQEDKYEQALAEVKRGCKRSHWMWYVFPQFEGLGFNPKAQKYSIKSIAEAEAYLNHPILGPRLTAIAIAALSVEGRSAHEIFSSPDDMKLQSCATLSRMCCLSGRYSSSCWTSFSRASVTPRRCVCCVFPLKISDTSSYCSEKLAISPTCLIRHNRSKMPINNQKPSIARCIAARMNW